jgi:hypothetical protein
MATWIHVPTGRIVHIPSWMHPATNDWDRRNWRKVAAQWDAETSRFYLD